MTNTQLDYDLFIIGGGINGCGIARDAAGRGLKVGLAEMNDLASATSGASTKLFHGGLRYLEYFEVRLVRAALRERETLLKAMPHISWPMRFVLPYHKDMRFESDTPVSRIVNTVMPWLRGRRPAWMIRMGLLLYDNLGAREILPGTATVDLRTAPEGEGIEDRFEKAFEYSDCWIEDSRLVVLNARDAELRGATIMTRTKVVSTLRHDDYWGVQLVGQDSGDETTVCVKMLVNAAGPWVEDIIQQKVRLNTKESVRLVRGVSTSSQSGCLIMTNAISFRVPMAGSLFAIPYETDYTLIGTTDAEQEDPDVKPVCTDAERDYLIAFANGYFKYDITVDDVVWSYSGVRPLYDDVAGSATAATRDYTLKVDTDGGAPILNIFGGKITTYRRLAEKALAKISPFFESVPDDWTAGVALPGGDFPVEWCGGPY